MKKEELEIKDAVIPEEPQTTSPTVPDDKVLIDKITLENILDRLNTIEGKKTIKTVSLKNKRCRVRFINDKIVVKYGKTWEETEKDNSKVLKIEVITEDGVRHTVSYVDFMEGGKQELAEIISFDKEEIIQNFGYTTVKKVDYDNYTTIDTGREVPVEVKTDHYTFKLKLVDSGREISLDESAVN